MPTMEEIKTALGKMGKSSEKPLIETSNILNENINPIPFSEKLFAPVEKLENKIQSKDKIIEDLKNETLKLKNKVSQGKAGPRSKEILLSPTSENCIFALIYRIEYENFTEVIDISSEKVEFISKKVFTVFDGWVRESLSELINNVLSLPAGTDQDHAKRILKQKMENLYDKELKKNLYSVCRSLKILI